MATLDDVLTALVTTVSTAVSGISIVGPYIGWPVPTELDKDIRDGKSHVSIFVEQVERLATKWRTYGDLSVPASVGLTATVSAKHLLNGSATTSATGSVTFAGQVTGGATMIIQIGSAFISYTPPNNSNLSTVASGLANAINSQTTIVTATNSGSTVNISTNSLGVTNNLIAFGLQIGGIGQLKSEQRRQKRNFTIHVWSPDNPTRGQIANAIDLYISQIDFLQGLTPQQDELARIYYVATVQDDTETRHGIFRRILKYCIEYTTTILLNAYQVLEPNVTVAKANLDN